MTAGMHALADEITRSIDTALVGVFAGLFRHIAGLVRRRPVEPLQPDR